MDSNRKYLGMTIPQLGILGGLAGALCLILCVGSYLIVGGNLTLANPQPVIPTVIPPTVTLASPPTMTPTLAPTAIPYEQLIPSGWKQFNTSLIEMWMPTTYKQLKSLPEGTTLLGVSDLILNQPASKTTSLYPKWVVVQYEPLTTESLDTFIDQKILSAPSLRVVERRNVTLNTAPAIRVLVETRFSSNDFNELTYVFQDGGVVWYVTFLAQINEFYAELETFEKSVLTFRILK